MLVSVDLANMNVRREQLAHILHYKLNIHEMKRKAREAGRPIKILDVGCGEANTVRMFYAADHTEKGKVIKEYVGLEGDPRCVEHTEAVASTVLRGINGRIEVCDITRGEFPVNPGSQDLILCNEVLEHIPRRAVPKVLRAIRRAARSSATIIITTPNKDGTNERLPADHVYEHGYDEIQEEFKEARLVVEDHFGIYIKVHNLRRYLREQGQLEDLAWAERVWDRFGNDMGSVMTAHMATPVANNCAWILSKG